MVTLALIVGIEGSGKIKFAQENLVEKQNFVLVSRELIKKGLSGNKEIEQKLNEAFQRYLKASANGEYYEGDEDLSEKHVKERIRHDLLKDYSKEETEKRIAKTLSSGCSLVLDDPMLIYAGWRKKVIEELKTKHDIGKVTCYLMHIEYSSCAAALANELVPVGKSPREAGIDLKQLTEHVYQMSTELEQPMPKEGLNEIIEVTREGFGRSSEFKMKKVYTDEKGA